MKCWKDGLDFGACTILYFRYLGRDHDTHEVQLVDIGLPNHTGDLGYHPKHGPCVPMVSRHPIKYEVGKY